MAMLRLMLERDTHSDLGRLKELQMQKNELFKRNVELEVASASLGAAGDASKPIRNKRKGHTDSQYNQIRSAGLH
jgi:hypothetical protein